MIIYKVSARVRQLRFFRGFQDLQTNNRSNSHRFILTPCAQDLISGDEIISDSYDLIEKDGVVYEVDCAMITEGAVQVSEYSWHRGLVPKQELTIAQTLEPTLLLRRPMRVPMTRLFRSTTSSTLSVFSRPNLTRSHTFLT